MRRNGMRIKSTGIYLLVILLLIVAAVPAWAADTQLQRTGRVVHVELAGGFYGILGDDGVKYQPTNLPHQYRKDGTLVKFIAWPREDMFTSVMWGKVIEIKTMENINGSLSDAERTAIYLLGKRLEAFNQKDLEKLQDVDSQSKSLLPQQFMDWLGNYTNFTLRYVNIGSADSTTITGFCIYTRELPGSMDLKDGENIAAMQFTLSRKRDGWKLTDSSAAGVSGLPQTLSGVKELARQKYGTDNLNTLWFQ